jgi:hypothetical protein
MEIEVKHMKRGLMGPYRTLAERPSQSASEPGRRRVPWTLVAQWVFWTIWAWFTACVVGG